MDRYISAMSDYTQEVTLYWYEDRLEVAEKSLRNWMNERTKHSVIDFFDEFDNRICYAKRLYKSRVECFYQILKGTEINTKIREIISNTNSIVSFGCGPGPEIAAYISYVREDLGCKYLELNIKAVDCLKEWQPFINAVACLDDYATIQFQAGLLSNKYLLNMKSSDVCIMSYPHAMNFEDIWTNLKRKFTLIIFIDQAKGPLLDKARMHGFQFVNFFCKGNKTFFYYIDLKCKRGLHSVSYHTDICTEIVDMALPCLHTFKMYCYQNEEKEKVTVKCTTKVTSYCPRIIHKSVNNCGSPKKTCKEIREIMLSCGHKGRKLCYDNSVNSQPCSVLISKTCQRGYHSKLVTCSSNFICVAVVSSSFSCGHPFEFQCYEDAVLKMKSAKCNLRLSKNCHRGLHKIVFVCGSTVACHNIIQVERSCGHLLTLKCNDSDSKEMNRLPCNELITKTCERGLHKTVISCSSPFVCSQEVTCKRDCGHKCIIKCFQDQSLIPCRKIVDKLCKRNIHKSKEECGKTNICAQKCLVYGKCGCQKIVNCDDFKKISGNFNCSDDCKLKAKESVLIELNSDYVIDHHKGQCDRNKVEWRCDCQCNKLLLCGHWCKWKCFQCLHGRLHRSCLEKCSRTLNCGHVCADFCHGGSCENCIDNCFINKMREFFRIKYKLSSKDQSKWTELIEPFIGDVSSDVKDFLEIIIYKVKYDEFYEKEVDKFNKCFAKMKNLLNLHDVLTSLYFPSTLKKYTSYVSFSIMTMIKSLDPSSCSLTDSSLEDIDLELNRVKTIITICQVAKLESDKLNAICELMDNMRNEKYNCDAIDDVYTNLNEILTG